MDRREEIKKYKQTIQPMGIYQITNLKNGKLFIGSAKDLRANINRHKFQLQNGLHPDKQLQQDFIELGEDAFSFEIIDYLKPKEDLPHDYTEDLQLLLEMWLEKLQPYDEKGYNKKP